MKAKKKESHSQRIVMLFFIISRLISKRKVTTDEVAAKFNVSRRTVQRTFFTIVEEGLAKADADGLGIILTKKK